MAISYKRALTLNPLPNGRYTVSNPDGTVQCVNPVGNIEVRPAGTAGEWEQCDLIGVGLRYTPTADKHYLFLPSEA